MKLNITIFLIFISSVLFSQNEPWKRPLKICQSNNGVNFSNIQTFQDSSGVPNVIKLPSGVLISVFQWFRQPVGSLSWDRVAVKFSSDNGISWTQPQPIVVNGLPSNFSRPFDPTLAVTDSGRIRIYFSSGLNMILDTSINTYSAISDDGINYTMEAGFRFSLPDRPVIDPAVIKFRNLWHLINPFSNMTNGGAFHNISGDGINFTRVADIPSDMTHSWIGNFMIKDTNELRFYGSGMNVWYSSSTNGGVWSAFTNTNINGGDPSVLKLSDTNYLMIYTGQPYTTSASSNSVAVNDFYLYQNYPNPFNPVTVIRYSLRENIFVTLKLFDVTGNEIAVLINERQNQGNYNYQFSTGSYQLASGIYFYKLTAGKYSDTKRMILIK
ncbi:MAG: T9SS type A sorting domain-containing protein [Ignavibacteria bacterium]|nr:T9SS type A sorting domain-containing protein [Ignavibacteria bacterium]